MADFITLDIGGVKYLTSKSTLCTYPDSMLGRMFCGDIPSARNDEGHYVIDRNGGLFKYILDFLRCSRLALPCNFTQMEQLEMEADFYQIAPLVEAIRQLNVTYRPQLIGITETVYWARVNTGKSFIDSYRTNIIGPQKCVTGLVDSKWLSNPEPMSGMASRCRISHDLQDLSAIRLCMTDLLTSLGYSLKKDEVLIRYCDIHKHESISHDMLREMHFVYEGPPNKNALDPAHVSALSLERE